MTETIQGCALHYILCAQTVLLYVIQSWLIYASLYFTLVIVLALRLTYALHIDNQRYQVLFSCSRHNVITGLFQFLLCKSFHVRVFLFIETEKKRLTALHKSMQSRVPRESTATHSVKVSEHAIDFIKSLINHARTRGHSCSSTAFSYKSRITSGLGCKIGSAVADRQLVVRETGKPVRENQMGTYKIEVISSLWFTIRAQAILLCLRFSFRLFRRHTFRVSPSVVSTINKLPQKVTPGPQPGCSMFHRRRVRYVLVCHQDQMQASCYQMKLVTPL